MKNKYSIFITIVILLFILGCKRQNNNGPGILNASLIGWGRAGSKSKSYEVYMERTGRDGKNVATIKSIDEKNDGFETLMQKCPAEKFHGKRIRFSGIVRTKDVSGWAGIWLRIDQKIPYKDLGFDNLHDGKKDRSITGTSPWTGYDIVLDVPENATNLAYGALLFGTGQIWFDDFKFETVDDSVPTTGKDENNINPHNNAF